MNIKRDILDSDRRSREKSEHTKSITVFTGVFLVLTGVNTGKVNTGKQLRKCGGQGTKLLELVLARALLPAHRKPQTAGRRCKAE